MTRIAVGIFILFNALAFAASAQMAAFQDQGDLITPTFRYDIIKMKKVQTITIHFEEKPDGKPIHDDGIMQYYRFDSAGRLCESFYTIKEDNGWDTIRSKFYYDGKGRLITKRTNESGFYDTWYYVWYEDNNMLQKEAHVHETPAPGDMGDFKPGEQKMISCDSFAYSVYPKQTQRYGYNEEHTIYEKVISQYDDHKRFTGRYSHYEVGWLYSQVDLKYDSANHVKEYTYSANLNGEVHKTTKLKYDQYGNIQVEKVFSGDTQTNEIEYMYDEGTGLISNKLNRDYQKAIIEIDRYSYTFYDSDDFFAPR